MKKIIVIALAVLLGAGTMSAQRGGGHQRMSVENRVAQMTKELDLTPDQQKKITAIYTEAEAKRKSGERLPANRCALSLRKPTSESLLCLPHPRRKSTRR